MVENPNDEETCGLAYTGGAFIFALATAIVGGMPRPSRSTMLDVESAKIGFRSGTSHTFRNAAWGGHLAKDTAEYRALIQSAIDRANLRDTITLKDGSTLQKYFRELSDGTQAWAEVRNGEITTGGLIVIPR